MRTTLALPLLVTTAITATTVAPVLSAAPANSVENDDSMLILGLGVGHGSSIYTGVDDEASPIPVFAYETDKFYIHGPELGYQLLETRDMGLDVLVQYRMEGYEASDSPHLRGMAERKGAFELGLSGSWDSAWGEWSATALTDISSEHKGYELELGWEQRIELSQRWGLTPEASLSYRSKKLNNYYYGVSTSEATATRAAYSADGGMVYELGINADYMLDEQQQLRFGASYQRYGNEISDSSIVDDDNSVSVQAIYLYRF